MTITTPQHFLQLPQRTSKPRGSGLTIMIDNGLPTRAFADLVESASEYVDIVKFGWGTSIVTRHLMEKIRVLKLLGIEFFFGGTLFEKSLIQGKLPQYLDFCRDRGCSTVEVSNGTIDLDDARKSHYVNQVSRDFRVISEVGSKVSEVADNMSPQEWVRCITDDIDAGASLVTLETRESGRGGICRSNGELRVDVFNEIVMSGVDPRMLVFEAPTTDLQNKFVQRLGHNVNLANISSSDLIGLETVRLGLRSETLLEFEPTSHAESRLSA